jgi:MFS family permease
MSSSTTSAPAVTLRQDVGVIGVVGLAHLVSHFCQLLLPPLFPWLKDAFQVGYTELGFLMTVFFTVSCGVQAASGFLVDRFGPLPVLLGGLGMLGLAALGFAASTSYSMLLCFAVVAGFGNGVFHPVDYTLINRKVSAPRLGHAYSFHGVSGSLGWAVAPAILVPLAVTVSWRASLAVAALLAWGIWLLVWLRRDHLALPPSPSADSAKVAGEGDGGLAFLRLPAVWMCWGFFFLSACALSAVQTFAPEAARQLHEVPLAWVALCLSVYMAANAGGGIVGGFLVGDGSRSERIIGFAIAGAATVALAIAVLPLAALAVPILFGVMGMAVGVAGPSRDLIIKRSTPAQASGRVYGVVYSGLDIGQALAPLLYGPLMDGQHYQAVLLGLAGVQVALIFTAINVRRVAGAKPA